MSRVIAWLPGFALAALCGVLLLTPTSQAGDINFTEDFALAKDRTAALKQLIPGTEDYYYYNALHYLNTGQFDKIDALVGPWYQRHNQTARLTEIQTRQALLTFNKNPEKTLTYLRTRLGLNFDHQRETIGATTTNLVSVLDQNSISRETLRNQSISGWGNLDNFEDSALDWLAVKDDLGAGKRRNLLQRLTRPDVADLPGMVVEDLNTEHAGEFGYLGIHRQMTLAQLEEVLKLKPSVRNQSAFVQTYITKLQPGADEDWQRDRKLTLAYLERLQKFVDKLDPVHNALKAHVYFHRLAFDRANDVYDKARFMAYIQLPRFQPYMNAQFGQRVECQRHPAHLNADFNAITLLPTVNSDEAASTVRSFLKQFFTNDGGNTKDYEAYIDDGWLSRLYAETKIELGAGDPEQWASRLPPELFRALKDRIDIDFAFTNKTDFASDEAVSLDLNIKNVPTLLIKVFEVNTGTVYRTKLAEVDTDINLDGLVANSERAVKYEDSPFRRMARKFDFPELNKPGVYVIDFIGSGKSSRAAGSQGHLRPLVAVGIAGQNIRIVDDKNAAVNDATVWLGGQEYRPDKDGIVTVPYTAQPGRRPVVITRGDFSSLDFIQHQPENYRLSAGIHVDRESLLTQRVAPVIIRPGLFLNDTPVSLKLLEEVKLHITAIDNSDIPTSTEVPDFKLFEDRESIHEIRVPARLKSLTVTLTAKVKNMSTGKPVELGASKGFALNGIELTDKIEDLHLARFGAGYAVELLGRTGEVKPDRPVQLSFKHRDFKTQVNATLKTDPMGRVVLGPLTDIATVTATGPEGTAHTWTLSNDAHTYPLADSREGRRADRAAVPRHRRCQADPRRVRPVRSPRQRHPRRSLRGDQRAEWRDRDSRSRGRRLRPLPEADRREDSHSRRRRHRRAARLRPRHHPRHLQLPGLKPVHIVESIDADEDERHDQAARGVEVRPRSHLCHPVSAGVQFVRRPGPGSRRGTRRRHPRPRRFGLSHRPQHRRRVPLRPRPPVANEARRQHARPAATAAQSVGGALDRDRRATRGWRRRLRPGRQLRAAGRRAGTDHPAERLGRSASGHRRLRQSRFPLRGFRRRGEHDSGQERRHQTHPQGTRTARVASHRRRGPAQHHGSQHRVAGGTGHVRRFALEERPGPGPALHAAEAGEHPAARQGVRPRRCRG